MMILLVIWAVAVGLAVVHTTASRLWRRPLERAKIFLLYQLGVGFGASGVVIFVANALQPVETAAKIGWPASANFQFEVAAVGLGIAVGSLSSLKIRNRHFWCGFAVAPAIFMMLAGVNHVRSALDGNLAAYNVVLAVPDMLIPATVAWLLYRVFSLATDTATIAAAKETSQGVVDGPRYR
jgi:hypothetical protein